MYNASSNPNTFILGRWVDFNITSSVMWIQSETCMGVPEIIKASLSPVLIQIFVAKWHLWNDAELAIRSLTMDFFDSKINLKIWWYSGKFWSLFFSMIYEGLLAMNIENNDISLESYTEWYQYVFHVSVLRFVWVWLFFPLMQTISCHSPIFKMECNPSFL